MTAIQAHPQQGLDGLTLMDLPDPGDPGPNAIRVRVHATSLNFHDLGMVTGRLPAADGRIPMADGAGVVEAVGSEVTGVQARRPCRVHLLPDLAGRRGHPGRLRHHAGRRHRRFRPGREGAVPTAMLMSRQQRLQRLIDGSRRHQLDLIRGIDAVHGHPVIDRSFPLAELADAFRLQEIGGHFGKIVVGYRQTPTIGNKPS